jgi:tetratricopeptide (TPR) repeat protein
MPPKTRSRPAPPSWRVHCSTRRFRSPEISESRSALALVYGNVGLEALFAVDLDRARDAFGEQLEWCRGDGVRWLAAEALSGLAAIAAHKGEFDRAARLLGAATTAGPWDGDADVAEKLEEQFFAPARAVYGEDRWNEARATGAQLGLNQSIAFALSSATSAP